MAQVTVQQAQASAPTGQAPAPAQPSASFNTSLYVGDLDPDVNEAFLFEVFNNLGPVQSVRVCRDMVTKRSLGYAYVNYVNALDAERAYDTLNFSQIKGRPCRVMWSQRDPSLRKSGLGNIFVKNLEKHIDNKMLYDTFSRFGNILSCKVVQDEHGVSKGYAYIHFEQPEAAAEAIAKTNGMLLGGKGQPLVVALFQRKHDRSGAAFTNVYVKNIDENVTEQQLKELFSTVGEVTSLFLATEDGKSKGFGFVNYATSEQAQKAIDQFHDKEQFGRTLYVGRAQSKKEREGELRHLREQKRNERLRRFQGLNLYVKNLDDSIDDEKLRDAFAPFGTITSAKVMRDEKQASRGFGFVCFNTPEEAQKALQEMHNKVLGSKPIFVAMHQPKEQRKTYLEQLHSSRAAAGVRPMPGFPGQPGMYPPQPMYPYPGMRPGAPPPGQYPPYPPAVMRGGWRGPPPAGPQRVAPPYAQAGMFPPGQRPAGAQRPAARTTGQSQRPGPQGQQTQQPGGQRTAGFQFKANVRNATATQQATPEAQQTVPAPQPPIAVNEPLTPAALAAADPTQQKQILGERLFPLVSRHQPELGPKITGMLLQMDNSEILHLIESPEALAESIREALQVLQSAGYTAEEQQ